MCKAQSTLYREIKITTKQKAFGYLCSGYDTMNAVTFITIKIFFISEPFLFQKRKMILKETTAKERKLPTQLSA